MKSNLLEVVLELKNKNINADLKSTDFLQIQKPIQKGNYNELGCIAYEWLQKGYFDFRLISYFSYSRLLGNNDFLEVLSIISIILENYYNELGPKVNKDKHISQALKWFHKRLMVNFEDQIFINDLLKLLNTQSDIENFHNEILKYKNNLKEICNISYCENFNSIETKIFLLIQESEEITKNDFKTKIESSSIDNSNQKEIIEVINNNPNRAFYSKKLEKLLNKIDIFKKLLEQTNYQRAASVEYIIDQELEKYKIDYYFEELFMEYFSLKLKYLNSLSEHQDMICEIPDSKEIKILEKLLNSNEYLTQEKGEA